MRNIENAIKNYNAKILENSNREKGKRKACNCTNKVEYSLKGKGCRKENVIYETKTNNQTKTFIGLSSNEIKKRIATHATQQL